jgi:hypothetical protein
MAKSLSDLYGESARTASATASAPIYGRTVTSARLSGLRPDPELLAQIYDTPHGREPLERKVEEVVYRPQFEAHRRELKATRDRVEALEDLVEDLGGSVDALQVLLPRNEDIAAFAEKQVRDLYNATAMSILTNTFGGSQDEDEKPEEFESPGVGATYSLRPYPSPPLHVCPIHDHVSPEPCPTCSPAPPPSADPAGETSSGGESCGEGTAGGAGSCCEPMRNFVTIWGPLHVAGSDVEGIGPPLFCLWCASPLREDGELKVGSQGRAETSNPREIGDTLGGCEG